MNKSKKKDKGMIRVIDMMVILSTLVALSVLGWYWYSQSGGAVSLSPSETGTGYSISDLNGKVLYISRDTAFDSYDEIAMEDGLVLQFGKGTYYYVLDDINKKEIGKMVFEDSVSLGLRKTVSGFQLVSLEDQDLLVLESQYGQDIGGGVVGKDLSLTGQGTGKVIVIGGGNA